MEEGARSGVVKLSDAEARIPGPEGERNTLAIHRGTLDIRLSLPVPPNVQSPHVQDEFYVVIRGNGVLVHGGARSPFAQGDILFVAAGVEHHYEDFSADLALWRIFYGADGGEFPA